MKTWEIYRYTYGDVCSDPWFGKASESTHIGFVIDTEENVKAAVSRLNEKYHSHFPLNEPSDEFDDDYLDANYIAYKEVKTTTLTEIENREYLFK